MRIMENEVRLVMMDIDGTIVNFPHNRSETKELCETVRHVAERRILIGLVFVEKLRSRHFTDERYWIYRTIYL